MTTVHPQPPTGSDEHQRRSEENGARQAAAEEARRVTDYPPAGPECFTPWMNELHRRWRAADEARERFRNWRPDPKSTL